MRIKESELTNLLDKVRDLKELNATDKQRFKIIENWIRYQNKASNPSLNETESGQEVSSSDEEDKGLYESNRISIGYHLKSEKSDLDITQVLKKLKFFLTTNCIGYFLFADKVLNLKKWKFYDLLKKAKRLEALNPAEKFFIQKIHNWTTKFEKDSTKVVRLSENDLANLNQNWSNQRDLDQDSDSDIEILNDKAKDSGNDSEKSVSRFKKVPEKLRNILSANKIEFGTFAAQVLKIEEKYFATLLEKAEKCENLNEIDKSYLMIIGNWINNKSPWFISDKAFANCVQKPSPSEPKGSKEESDKPKSNSRQVIDTIQTANTIKNLLRSNRITFKAFARAMKIRSRKIYEILNTKKTFEELSPPEQRQFRAINNSIAKFDELVTEIYQNRLKNNNTYKSSSSCSEQEEDNSKDDDLESETKPECIVLDSPADDVNLDIVEVSRKIRIFLKVKKIRYNTFSKKYLKIRQQKFFRLLDKAKIKTYQDLNEFEKLNFRKIHSRVVEYEKELELPKQKESQNEISKISIKIRLLLERNGIEPEIFAKDFLNISERKFNILMNTKKKISELNVIDRTRIDIVQTWITKLQEKAADRELKTDKAQPLTQLSSDSENRTTKSSRTNESNIAETDQVLHFKQTAHRLQTLLKNNEIKFEVFANEILGISEKKFCSLLSQKKRDYDFFKDNDVLYKCMEYWLHCFVRETHQSQIDILNNLKDISHKCKKNEENLKLTFTCLRLTLRKLKMTKEMFAKNVLNIDLERFDKLSKKKRVKHLSKMEMNYFEMIKKWLENLRASSSDYVDIKIVSRPAPSNNYINIARIALRIKNKYKRLRQHLCKSQSDNYATRLRLI